MEEACLEAFDPPITLIRPSVLAAPTIFCSPHSGRIYPQEFTARSGQSLASLRRNEDAFIDSLFGDVPSLGAPFLAARFPRCFLDVSRAEDELPQKWLPRGEFATARAQAGLGLIPLVLGEGLPIYRRALKPSAVQPRIDSLYRPYHSALKGLRQEAMDEFGEALIIDCHSMPGFTPSGTRRADVILGDRHGTSCHPATIARIEGLFVAKNYSVARNYPYAGSYITSHYGQPLDGVEAIQIEINRDLYLNPVTLERKKGYKTLEEDLFDISKAIIRGSQTKALLAAE